MGKELEQPYLLSLAAESQALLGNTSQALESLAVAIEKLPLPEMPAELKQIIEEMG